IVWSGATRGNVRIELSRDSGLTFESIFSNVPNDEVQVWEVDGPPSTHCRLRLTLLDDPTITAESATDFTIADTIVGMTVTNPNGGETWEGGSERLITWSAPGDGNVRIELSRDGGVSWETLFAETPNDGMEPWTVTGPPATCRIRISHVDDPALEDESDGDFFISSGVTVTAPAGGEVWVIGSQQQITWTAAGAGDVSIALSRNGEPVQTIIDRTPNDGAELWTVAGPVTTARILITLLDDPTLSGESHDDFFITQTPGVTVVEPNGTEVWTVGSRQLIRWETIIPRTPNDGAQFWTVTGPPTFGALIRVVGLDDLPGIDFSDPFTISSGTLDLSQPNGGERWAIGTAQGITWSTTTGGTVS